MYLLEGGYKRFFEEQPALCEPQDYKPMLHEDHGADLRHFRAKSKSWAGEKVARGPGGVVVVRPGLRAMKDV